MLQIWFPCSLLVSILMSLFWTKGPGHCSRFGIQSCSNQGKLQCVGMLESFPYIYIYIFVVLFVLEGRGNRECAAPLA